MTQLYHTRSVRQLARLLVEPVLGAACLLGAGAAPALAQGGGPAADEVVRICKGGNAPEFACPLTAGGRPAWGVITVRGTDAAYSPWRGEGPPPDITGPGSKNGVGRSDASLE